MLKILYCNWCLLSRSGTEIVTVESVQALRALGHKVAVLTWHPGKPAESLRQSGIPVVTSLSDLPWVPDIIHSNHLPQTLLGAVHFPSVPQVFVCHDSDACHSAPTKLPCIKRYCAVDEICGERLHTVTSSVTILPNAVDLERFVPRMRLPERPAKALLLARQSNHVPTIQRACDDLNITLEVLGAAFDREVDDLHVQLCKYDVVFAVARNALEAMATGCAVIVVDGRGMAGMVTSSNVDRWRANNFGKRLLRPNSTVEQVIEEIRKFDQDDAQRVTQRIREVASLNDYIQVLNDLYTDVVAECQHTPIEASTVSNAFPNAFCAAIPDLLPLMSLSEVASYARSLPAIYQSLWAELDRCGRSS